MALIKFHGRICIMMLVVIQGWNLSGQYQIKPIDISKNITSMSINDDGSIQYGTNTGEVGRYDGIQFYKEKQFEGSINKFVLQPGNDAGLLTLTERGIHSSNINSFSTPILDVLACNQDLDMLVTGAGIYQKEGNDYRPDKEEFFNINEVEQGQFFEMDGISYVRIDGVIYKKKKRWEVFLDHSEDDFGVLKWNDSKFLVADRNGLSTIDKDGIVDTLLRRSLDGDPKIFKIDHSKVLFCGDDSIGIFNTRKRDLDIIYNISAEMVSDVIVDEWGNIWIAAGSYLYQFVNEGGGHYSDPPKLKILSIEVNGNVTRPEKGIRLDNESNDIEFTFQGVHLTLPQELRYQTLLEKKNASSTKWSEPTKNQSIDYRNLGPGNYKFQVRATVDDRYFTYSKPIEISVSDNTFQSILLIAVLAGMGILILALIYNARYNRFKKSSDQERKNLIQENKLLTLHQKALQLQMNPHFVFNALNSIQGLVAKEDSQKARKYLREFSTMMRSVLNQSREESVSIEEEIKYLKSYLSLEQMANNHSFDWTIEISPDAEDDIRIPTMIVQPFIENAILHGVKPLNNRRGSISVKFVLNERNVECTIEDNGLGRFANKDKGKSNHKSVAIDVVMERLSSKMGKKKSSPIEYTDLENDNGLASGTRVKLLLPILT